MSKHENMRTDHGYCNTVCFVVPSKISFVTEVELSANIRWFFDYEGFCILSLTRDFKRLIVAKCFSSPSFATPYKLINKAQEISRYDLSRGTQRTQNSSRHVRVVKHC